MSKVRSWLVAGFLLGLVALVIGLIYWAELGEAPTFQEQLVAQVDEDARLLSAGEYDDEAGARTQAFVDEHPECTFSSAVLGPFTNKVTAESIRKQAVAANEEKGTYANFTTAIVNSRTGLYYVLAVGANCEEK